MQDCHDAIWGWKLKPVMENTHFYAVGKSGFGKSTLLKNKVFENLDQPIFFLDPSGKDARDLMDALPPHTKERICYFDFSATTTPTFNPILEPWHAILPFQTIWKDSYGPRLNYELYQALAAVYEAKLTLQEVPRLFHSETFRKRTMEKVTTTATFDFWTKEYPKWPQRIQQEAAIALYNKVGLLLASPIAKAITPRPHHATYDFKKALDEKIITIVNLSKAAVGDENAYLLAALFTTTFRSALLQNPTKCLFISDEFQNSVPDLLISMLSENRKDGLQLGLAHQFASQIEERLLDAILGNVRDAYIFNVQYKDAKLFAASMRTTMQDFTDDLMNLPPYTAYVNGIKHKLPDFLEPCGHYESNVSASRMRFRG
jgi:hypothetical protein